MAASLITLKVLLPFQVFAEKTDVTRVVAETRAGSFGLLPHRLDCAAALVPGILTFETAAEGEVYLAVDEFFSRSTSIGERADWAKSTSFTIVQNPKPHMNRSVSV